MTESGIFVQDVQALEQFSNSIDASGQAMSAIDQQVSKYLSEVKDTLEEQLDYIQRKLQDAEAKLRDAEAAASACHASQMCIEGVIIPSCIAEESAVSAAQMEVEDWTRRHAEGTRIFSECQREVTEYLSPEGGHGLVTNMCDRQSPEATQQLSGCFGKLQDILNHDTVSNDTTTNNSVAAQQSAQPSDNEHIRTLKKLFKL